MNPNNISSSNNFTVIDQYVNGKLQGEALHNFEREMIDNPMLNDAVEGLQQIEDKKNIEFHVADLNKHLLSITKKQKGKRGKKIANLHQTTFFAIAFVLILCLLAVCFFVFIS
jgi:hypothetical protein